MNRRYTLLVEKFVKTSLRQSVVKSKSKTGKLYKAKQKDQIIINPNDTSTGGLYVSR